MDRGVMSGTRTETVTYIAQSGGTATFPQIVLNWYNLETEEVEEIVLEGRTVTVGVPSRERTAIDRRNAGRAAFLLVLIAALGWAAHRWLWPVVRPKLNRIKAGYDGSAHAAQRIAERRAAAGDLGGLIQALELRAAGGHHPSCALSSAIEALSCAVYRDGKTEGETRQLWQSVCQNLRQERPGLPGIKKHRDRSALALLNPF
jgi:hypothetical protein